jgi:hypothetical protein
MASSIDPKTVAIIYNGGLPAPLGGLGAYVASEVARFISQLNPVLVDVKSLSLPKSPKAPQDLETESSQDGIEYDHEAFRDLMSQHVGYFFVFPGHVWSHTQSLKQLVSQLPRHVYANKPTAVITYTREDTRPWYQKEANQSYEHVPRSSAPMLADYLSRLVAPEDTKLESLSHSTSSPASKNNGRRRGFNLVPMSLSYDGQPVPWPEFRFFWDIWDDFPSSNSIWPGGNQIEAWEAPGWGKCITVAEMMRTMIERS